jgi:CDP-diacylglycerol---glycerol-3-phosphate 3-phosphatidyltransferase
MSLYDIKPWFVRRLRRFEDVLVARRVSPDTLTFAAVGVSVAAGGFITAGGLLDRPLLWLVVAPLVLVRLALNALDGSVARRTRSARPFGAALNEIGDRVSDAATVGATAFVAKPALAFGALASCYLASSMGILSLALTGRRDSDGPVGKADRAALLSLGATAGALAGSAMPFTVVLVAIAAGAAMTTAMRLMRMRRTLQTRGLKREMLAESFVEVPCDAVPEEEMLHAVGR